ncbi:MAG: DUF5702 domain-containing protein [Acetatifactor sp.]|nr:DUF5702 domain-containing protein [Acetatifactor sp.]
MRRNRRRHQGIITVFVTLIMVPVVLITGILVDVSRLKLYSSQAVMAADAYGDGILSEFDNLLRELYGLFSVTQDEEGLKAIETLKKYAGYSFQPDGDGIGVSGFMPYENADVVFSYEAVPGASLSNENVLMTQISDFMKYRIVEEVLDSAGTLNILQKFDNMNADMNAMNSRKEITDSCEKALEEIGNYYTALKKLAAYPDYLTRRQNAFGVYSSKLTEIAGSEEYEKYVNYLLNRSIIDAAREKFERIANNENSSETMSAEDMERYDQYVDVEVYKKSLEEQLKDCQSDAANHTDDPIDIYHAGETIRDLEKSEKALRTILQDLETQLTELNASLEDCSEDVKEKMKEEIRELENIVAMADDFRQTCELIEGVHHNFTNNEDNRSVLEREVPLLDAVKENLLTGNVQCGDSYWTCRIDHALFWYDFRDDKAEFYRQLQKLFEGGGNGGQSGGNVKKQANQAMQNAQKELEEEETTTARSITPELAVQLAIHGGSAGKIPGIGGCFSGGLSFQAVTSAGSRLLDKFLLVTYDFGMFSSRVTGKGTQNEPPAAGGIPQTQSEESLTKVKLSADVNYLYGAELEYLLGGHTSSADNLKEARNMICGVRMTLNFASSYLVSEVNTAIKSIANAAAAAASATGIGAVAAPLIRVSVSGVLRLAFATIETAADWKELKSRGSVALLKRKTGDLQATDILKGLLKTNLSDKTAGGGVSPDYEDYLFVLLCLSVSDSTLLSRTSDLITLNLNQAVNDQETLSVLNFKMSDTVTAVKTTCKVRMKFAVVPEALVEGYLGGTGTDSLIEVLEDHYFGYSVIRGY